MRLAIAAAVLAISSAAYGHDIYTGLHMIDGLLPCCGGEGAGASRDCWRTVYREIGDRFQFRMQNGDWVEVPNDRIQFTPIPNDPVTGDAHEAHLCYRDDESTLSNYHDHNVPSDRLMRTVSGAEIVFFCGIIPPGGY